MEYIDDEEKIKELMKAVQKIKDWAIDQMGSMRKPKSSEVEIESRPDEEGFSSDMEEEMEHPMDEESMEMDVPVKEEKTIIAMGPKFGSKQGPEDDMMKKLEKYGRKRR